MPRGCPGPARGTAPRSFLPFPGSLHLLREQLPLSSGEPGGCCHLGSGDTTLCPAARSGPAFPWGAGGARLAIVKHLAGLGWASLGFAAPSSKGGRVLEGEGLLGGIPVLVLFYPLDLLIFFMQLTLSAKGAG